MREPPLREKIIQNYLEYHYLQLLKTIVTIQERSGPVGRVSDC